MKSPPACSVDALPDQLDSAAAARTPSPPSSSSSSSPAQSPEIEVAELEDMQRDPNTASWRPLADALRDDPAAAAEVVQLHEPLSLTDSFPKLRGHRDRRESLEEISHMIEKGHPHDVPAFVAVKNWLDYCVQSLDQITHDTLADDREFWEEWPTLVESLLRRGAPGAAWRTSSSASPSSRSISPTSTPGP
ncbi:hypothetical protein VTN02DRAFT_1510 [Thermoascus thermophilus]